MSTVDKNELYGWIFTFNPITGNYRCCTRDQFNDFFSIPEENFLRSKNIQTLEELIIKTRGNATKVKTLLK